MDSFDLSHAKDSDLIRNLEFRRPAVIVFHVSIQTKTLCRLRKLFEKRGEYLTDPELLERAIDLFSEQARPKSR
ncbi:MAG TPA: hypothetical protein VGR66_12565 [Candidatus Eisenbacteria bacterium]|nr:hypothetical protein [Candidatus Eisenbacteria bacterium]